MATTSCSSASRWRSSRAPSLRWSARPAAARPRCCACCSARSSRRRGQILVDGKAAACASRTPTAAWCSSATRCFRISTVLQNVMLGRELRDAKLIGRLFGAASRAAEDDAMKLLAEVGLAGQESKYPSALSGGMQQRLALAQAIMRGPKILLLDEPFGALDPGIRADIHVLMKRLWNETESHRGDGDP